MSFLRPASEQRRLLVATIRDTAMWRAQKVRDFGDDPHATRQNRRAKLALQRLANFVESLPDDDPDLDLYALRRVPASDGRLLLAEDGRVLLSRFGLSRGSWNEGPPTEAQMRNLLRRLDGIEARERHMRKQRAEAGYGDD